MSTTIQDARNLAALFLPATNRDVPSCACPASQVLTTDSCDPAAWSTAPCAHTSRLLPAGNKVPWDRRRRPCPAQPCAAAGAESGRRISFFGAVRNRSCILSRREHL